jgi:hypothetical protein
VPSVSGRARPLWQALLEAGEEQRLQRRHGEERIPHEGDGDVDRRPCLAGVSEAMRRAACERHQRAHRSHRQHDVADGRQLGEKPEASATSTVSHATSDSACGTKGRGLPA